MSLATLRLGLRPRQRLQRPLDGEETTSYEYDDLGNRQSHSYLDATAIADPPRPQHSASSPTITRPRLITVRIGLTPT